MHAWQAAKFASLDLCPPSCSEQTGSAEHHQARLSARCKTSPQPFWSPNKWRTHSQNRIELLLWFDEVISVILREFAIGRNASTALI